MSDYGCIVAHCEKTFDTIEDLAEHINEDHDGFTIEL